MTDLYAVVGNPISHSKSPRIHALFAANTRQDMEYTAIQAPVNAFADTVADFFDAGGQGLNVTVPFKQEAWALCQWRSERAQRSGAVNTLWQDEQGRLCGDNTDGAGLVRDLTLNHPISLTGKNLLLLGAGGAARGVLQPLLAQAPATLVIANRTLQKAQDLVDLFPETTGVRACHFRDLSEPFDLIINATSASLAGDLPPLPNGIITPQTFAYDMMYGPHQTPFNQWAQGCGAHQCIDGLGMLVEQAAEAFFLWRKIRPDTASVLALLRDFR